MNGFPLPFSRTERTSRRRAGLLFTLPLLTLLTLAIPMRAAAQMTDVVVTAITLPPLSVPTGTPVGVQFTLQNAGVNNATDFFCQVGISSASAPSTPIFQEQINVASLPAGATTSLMTQGTWPAGEPGDYIVTVAAIYEFDNEPTNNLRQHSFVVTPQSSMLTLTEAVAILNGEVLDGHPRAELLTAVYLSPPANPSDSLLPAGTLIESADSSLILQYDYPVYFFFVDLYPDQLFAHPVEYIAISADDGTIDRQTNVDMWPEINGVTPDFGSDCFGDPNSRRVRGQGINCAEKPVRYEPVATSNTGAWAVAVVGKLNKEVEKTTADHDLCRWKERMNARGSMVTGPNISGSTGTDGCGMTEQELCDAIEALKGKECDKVYFKYIGHGKPGGIFVWDNEHKRTKMISWRDLAKKLKEAGVGEVCIEITACHSGAIIDALKEEGIKGVVITSSSSGNTTPVGEGDGTHWEKALEACSKDEMADLDRNGTIDQCELFAWVKVRGGTAANGPNPQIFKLNDSVRIRSVQLIQVGGGGTITTNAGGIRVRGERICLRRTINRRDSVVYRGGVYLINEGRPRRTADRSYEIIGRCNGRDTVLATVRPSLAGGERICVADLPNGCTRISVRRLRNATERKDYPIGVASSAPDNGYEGITQSVTADPGQFIFLRHPILSDINDQMYATSITGPAGWNVTVAPDDFFIPESDTADFFVGVNVPADAAAGGQVVATVVNTATSDTLDLIYDVHIVDTLQGDSLADWQGAYRWYDVLGHSRINGIGLDVRNTVFAVVDTLSILRPEVFDMRNSAISAGENGVIIFEEGNTNLISAEMRGGALYGTENGFFLASGAIDIVNLVVAESRGRGLTITGSPGLRIDTLRGVSLLGTAGPALVLDSITRPVRIEDLTVERAGAEHIILSGDVGFSCVDCSYDDANTDVESGSILRRYARLNVVVTDPDENPQPDISVRITAGDGSEFFSGLTDPDGFIPTQELLLSTNDGGTLTEHGPYYVTVRTDQVTVQDTIDATGWTGRVFVLPADATSVDDNEVVAGESVSPHPVRRGEELTILLPRLADRSVSVRLHDATGRLTMRLDGFVNRSGMLGMLLPDAVPAGMYLMVVEDGEGGRGVRRIVVR